MIGLKLTELAHPGCRKLPGQLVHVEKVYHKENTNARFLDKSFICNML
jgi:hypothetical protein